MRIRDFLEKAKVDSVVAMPLGDVAGYYLDLVLSSADDRIRITGAAADVENRTEAFYLTGGDFEESDAWTGPGGKPGWDAQNLTAQWQGTSLASVWLAPRVVHYYLDEEDRDRGLSAEGPFRGAAALEILPGDGSRDSRLVIYASPEYPCALELITDSVRCEQMLAGLHAMSA